MTPDEPVAQPDARAGSRPEISLVVPFYDPGVAVLADTVARAAAALEQAGATYEVIAVSDGSTDGSAEALLADEQAWLSVLVQPENRGKGHALRLGFARAR